MPINIRYLTVISYDIPEGEGKLHEQQECTNIHEGGGRTSGGLGTNYVQ